MTDKLIPPVPQPGPVHPGFPVPEPEIFVPLWPDRTPKAEKFIKPHERVAIDESKRRREEWRRDRERERARG